MNNKEHFLSDVGDLLGDHTFSKKTFADIESQLASFSIEPFISFSETQKNQYVNQSLLGLIKTADGDFLLQEVIDFISRVQSLKIVKKYSLSSFELWLNHNDSISKEENYKIRAKITGRYLPRDDYQTFFPIGMGKNFYGSHFVTAHSSPDLDTTVASFWGWVDAFSARIGTGLHLWNVPDGPPTELVETKLLFLDMLGEGVFDVLVKKRSLLTLSSIDLMTQDGFLKKKKHDSSMSFDHNRDANAIVLVDDNGHYMGDWRHFDVEGVRQVITSLNDCLRSLEGSFYKNIIGLLAKKDVTKTDVATFKDKVFAMTLNESSSLQEFTLRQKKYLDDYLKKVLNVKEGLETTFKNFGKTLEESESIHFSSFLEKLEEISSSHFFENDSLKEDRPLIFSYLETLRSSLSGIFGQILKFVDTLDIALKIKSEVFGFLPQAISHRTDIEEIKSKMGSYPYLTVNFPDGEGKEVPFGIVSSKDLKRAFLGSVTLRDFCNFDEMKIPDYLQVISVIDHHKATLNTKAPPMALIADAQSANSLVAELSFSINDKYASNGMTLDEIEAQLKEVGKDLSNDPNIRVYQRLLQKKMATQSRGEYYSSPKREFVEYLQYLYAIMDDTDLLSKVSKRDVYIVASLLNRMKSLMLKKEMEIINFDDLLSSSEDFANNAAKKLLQNKDFYSLYSIVYSSKEEKVSENLIKASEGTSLSIFDDTKTLNLCTRVGQTKLFEKNIRVFNSHTESIQGVFIERAKKLYENSPEIDLYMHMISTIPSAEDVYSGKETNYSHLDQLWFWVPPSDLGVEHLKVFLSGFKDVFAGGGFDLKFCCINDASGEYAQIFKESFLKISCESKNVSAFEDAMAVIYFKPGILNSRKAKIAPYLPSIKKS